MMQGQSMSVKAVFLDSMCLFDYDWQDKRSRF